MNVMVDRLCKYLFQLVDLALLMIYEVAHRGSTTYK
jgi:hypothetical protein